MNVRENPVLRDVLAGTVVFLVALPLCLGISLASGAPLISGVISGIVGGIVVGSLSGSHTSVSGPAAGLTAVVLAQIALLGSFEAFLLAVVVAGVLQIGLGLAHAGALSSFVPTSVIKGLLAAIGVILVLKQIPHVLGDDTDPEGEMAFDQPDHENTFSELLGVLTDLHPAAAVIGVLCVALQLAWRKFPQLAKSRLPVSLLVVVVGLAGSELFGLLGGAWVITETHRVAVPVPGQEGFLGLLTWPDFSRWNDSAIYVAGITIALVASLETLLNLEAVDKLDPRQRVSPPSRELWAQGVGNIVAGLLGGIPVTSVVIRGTVNVDAGAATKRSTIIHGGLLLVSVALLPTVLNRIPLSCLAAILLVTGLRLASPKLIKSMWNAGKDQFIPFAVTVLAIVFTDLLIGLGVGLAVALGFILARHARRPVRKVTEHHLDGEVLRVVLPDHLSFLNQTALERTLDGIPAGSRLLLDAGRTDYIDSDVLALIREFRDVKAPARDIRLSMIGFHERYELDDEIAYVDYSTRELQDSVNPEQVLEILRQGNRRFLRGQCLNRDLARQVGATAEGQHPLAVVLTCIDSRTPAEIVFDTGLGEIFAVRVAGNVVSEKVLGSIEFACAVAGARLVVVMGHTRCGAVTAAVKLEGADIASATGCDNLHFIVDDIHTSVGPLPPADTLDEDEQSDFVDAVARRNVIASIHRLRAESGTLARLLDAHRIAIVGVMYDVKTGEMEFMLEESLGIDASALDNARRDAEPPIAAVSFAR